MVQVRTVGIDLAKNVFQLHGVDRNGRTVLRKRLTREKLSAFMANLPRCLVGMEACGSAHYWAREFGKLGHEVKLINPKFVKAYVKSDKSDQNDAEGICEAVTRPSMRFVPVKTPEQQDLLALHRVRAQLVKTRTALANQMRGLLAERGIMVSYETVRRWVRYFGPTIAADLRRRRPKPHSTWHLDEVFIRIDGRLVYLWRAVDAEGEVLDVVVQS